MKNYKKLIILASLMIMILVVISGCGANTEAAGTGSTTSVAKTQDKDDLKTFTKEELKKYDGQNGNPAYVAVDGNVYDVTNVPFWKGGKHNGFEAGKDLTNEIKTKSPHGVSKLKDVPIVGKLVD